MDKNNENQQTKITETLYGGCHCGAVRFSIKTNSYQLLDCNCSICQMSGFLHLPIPHHQFELKRGDEKLSAYRFNTKQAEHLFCSVCGIKSFYQPRSHPDCWSVNARCLDDFNHINWQITQFDGQNWQQAKRNLTL